MTGFKLDHIPILKQQSHEIWTSHFYSSSSNPGTITFLEASSYILHLLNKSSTITINALCVPQFHSP
jgi:hypothetical protein